MRDRKRESWGKRGRTRDKRERSINTDKRKDRKERSEVKKRDNGRGTANENMYCLFPKSVTRKFIIVITGSR